MTAWALGLTLLLHAGGPPADAARNRGENELLNGNFSQALRDFELAARHAADGRERAILELLRAQCFAAMNDFGGVDAAFAAALRADPEAQLDRSQVLPTLVDRLDALRLRLQGTLWVSAQPRTVRVHLDGQPLAQNPTRTLLPIGRHHVTLVSLDGRKVERDVVLRPQTVERVEVDFARVPFSAPAPAPPVLVAAPGQSAPRSHPATALFLTAHVRANVQPRVGTGVEGGVGVSGQHWRVELGVSGASKVGLSLRAGAEWLELLGPVGFYATADGALILAGAEVPGVGGSLGAQVRLQKWLDLFAEGEYLELLGTQRFTRANVLIGAGARFKLPLVDARPTAPSAR